MQLPQIKILLWQRQLPQVGRAKSLHHLDLKPRRISSWCCIHHRSYRSSTCDTLTVYQRNWISTGNLRNHVKTVHKMSCTESRPGSQSTNDWKQETGTFLGCRHNNRCSTTRLQLIFKSNICSRHSSKSYPQDSSQPSIRVVVTGTITGHIHLIDYCSSSVERIASPIITSEQAKRIGTKL